MKHLLQALMVTAVLASPVVRAEMLDINFDLKTLGDNDNSSQGVTLSFPVIETGDPSHPIDWDATVAYIEAGTREGTMVNQLYDNGTHQVASVDDGSAQYLALGMRGRHMILNKHLEGIVKASYNQRIGGSTQYSRYSTMKNGELFDPYGGVNLGVGANAVFGDDVKMIVGGSVDRTMKSGKTVVRINIGARL